MNTSRVRRALFATLAAGLVLTGCAGSDKGTATQSSVAAGAAGSSSAGSSSAGSSSAGSSSAGAGSAQCSYDQDSEAAKPVNPPAAQAPGSGTVTATMTIGQGVITMELDQAATPCTVASFASLAGQGYFNDTSCHRLTATPSLSVLQCGDPSGSGSGGPGYSFADELTGDETYPRGTVAMANAGPNTNGSQFFLVYADSTLDPNYTVFGKITSGLEILDGIAAKGITGIAPTDPVNISSMTVS